MAQLVLRDMSRLGYQEAGAGPALLLIHGWGANSDFFEPQRRALAQRFRVITPDLRGHGASPIGSAVLTVDQLAADLEAFMEALDLREVLAVGWSLGAMAIWKMLQGPGRRRVAGIAVLDMSAKVANDGAWRLGLKGGIDSGAALLAADVMTTDWTGFTRAMAERLVAEGSQEDREPLIAWMAGQAALNAPGPLADLWRSLVAQDFREDLSGLDLPVLLAHGALSQFYAAETAEDLERRLPRARRVRFEHSGHALHLEEPDRFHQILIEFADALTRADHEQAPPTHETASKPGGGTP
ncbi:MAG: bioH [Caulobacteraceae bacterium]|nr:bioH [Caulobacteraceae bacterium]